MIELRSILISATDLPHVLAGRYFSLEAGLTIAGGGKKTGLLAQKDVSIRAAGEIQQGLEVTLGVGGWSFHLD